MGSSRGLLLMETLDIATQSVYVHIHTSKHTQRKRKTQAMGSTGQNFIDST